MGMRLCASHFVRVLAYIPHQSHVRPTSITAQEEPTSKAVCTPAMEIENTLQDRVRRLEPLEAFTREGYLLAGT